MKSALIKLFYMEQHVDNKIENGPVVIFLNSLILLNC